MAKLYGYTKNDVNELALEYYYKVFSDTNNIGATKTLLNHSRGTEDFTKFVNRLISKTDIVGPEWSQERNYLLKIGLNKDDCEKCSGIEVHLCPKILKIRTF